MRRTFWNRAKPWNGAKTMHVQAQAVQRHFTEPARFSIADFGKIGIAAVPHRALILRNFYSVEQMTESCKIAPDEGFRIGLTWGWHEGNF